MNDTFSTYHPAINFLFFGFVILTTIFVLHPVLLGISFVSALAYSLYLKKQGSKQFSLKLLIPLMVVAAVFNPLFNHAGVTILGYLRGNPITLESIAYGAAAAVMIGSVVLWFSCYHAVMTSDKFVYLFGRVIPSLSLVLSMALRFVPKYQAQIQRITQAQRGLGRDVSSGHVFARIKNGAMILSIATTWALENAIQTADSMKSRGHGLKGRTAYSIYRFDTRDRSLLIAILALLGVVLLSLGTKTVYVQYFPSLKMNPLPSLPLLIYIAHAIICLLPLLLGLREDHLFKKLLAQNN